MPDPKDSRRSRSPHRRDRSEDELRGRDRRRDSISMERVINSRGSDRGGGRSSSRQRRRSRDRSRQRGHSYAKSRSRSRSRSPPARHRHAYHHRDDDDDRKHKRRRHPTRSRSSSSRSSEGDSEEGRKRKRRKEKEKEKRRRHSGSRERKEKKKKSDKKKDKKKSKVAGSVTSQWGKYGVINETDLYTKEEEFRSWLIEECMVNPETLTKDQTKKHFAKFTEDFNTATLPHEKFYNMKRYEGRMALLRNGEFAPKGDENTYDVNADFRAHSSALKMPPSEKETYLSKQQLKELQRVERERVEVSKRKQLGLEVSLTLGVRMEDNHDFED